MRAPKALRCRRAGDGPSIALASAELFTALKLIGAVYLIWIGLRTFRYWRRPPPAPVTSVIRHRGTGPRSSRPRTAAQGRGRSTRRLSPSPRLEDGRDPPCPAAGVDPL